MKRHSEDELADVEAAIAAVHELSGPHADNGLYDALNAIGYIADKLDDATAFFDGKTPREKAALTQAQCAQTAFSVAYDALKDAAEHAHNAAEMLSRALDASQGGSQARTLARERLKQADEHVEKGGAE